MMKRMLIDDTQPEETRVVVINGNKLEDVEFETTHRKQIKGNIYLAKVMRVEPSLQAAFVDYGGNRHGFLAFGEIHPDYYNVSEAELAEVEQEVDTIIENKKQALKEREAERERIRAEKAARYAARKAAEEALKAEQEAAQSSEGEVQGDDTAAQENVAENAAEAVSEAAADEASESQNIAEDTQNPAPIFEAENAEIVAAAREDENTLPSASEATESENEETSAATENEEEATTPKRKRRFVHRRPRRRGRKFEENKENKEGDSEEFKVLSESAGTEEETISEEHHPVEEAEVLSSGNDNDDDDFDDDEDDEDVDFELQRKLMKARKLFYRSHIQDVIKEGQILLVQVVKEERGNKGAALTTYLSLAGRYCVLMPNRIKSGGVSRKITNAADRKRLKGIVKDLPLTSDMSMIVRTAGEEKTKSDIVRDYNYLIRAWNQIRIDALKNKAPMLIHEEGNLIKRALRDIYTKDISEILVAGDEAHKMAKDFFKILSPHNLKKIKHYRNSDIPLFQRFQVETQLDKLHETTAQLESGGYLVINPTEALVAIDVNSGRATKEKDLEETALKTNLEACDEIARQLRMRNLAGLVVIDFIDMEEPANNHAVEKRMKEALKKDRSRIQVGKMSCFGLLEISRQRMHSSFWESNYQTCPYCNGKGIVRTIESGAVMVLRGIEEEGIRNRSSKVIVTAPTDIALYILNHKRQNLVALEHKYKMEIVISADNSIKNVSDYTIERTKSVKTENEPVKEVVKEEPQPEEIMVAPEVEEPQASEAVVEEKTEENVNADNDNNNRRRRFGRRDNRRGRRNGFGRNNRFNRGAGEGEAVNGEHPAKEKQQPVILYNSHEDTTSSDDDAKKEKTTWWRKLIG